MPLHWQQGEDLGGPESNGRRGYGVGLGGLFGDGPVARLSDEQWRGTDLLYLGLCKRLSGVARPLRRKTTRYTRTHRVVVNNDTRVHKQLCAYMRHVPRITGLINEEQC